MMEQQTKDVQSPTASREKHRQSTTVLDAIYSIVTTSSASNTTMFNINKLETYAGKNCSHYVTNTYQDHLNQQHFHNSL